MHIAANTTNSAIKQILVLLASDDDAGDDNEENSFTANPNALQAITVRLPTAEHKEM